MNDLRSADAVVAVGTKAALFCHQHLPAPALLTYCMIADPSGAGLTKGRQAHGLSVTVALEDQVKLIRQSLPKARSLGVLYRSDVQHDGHLLGRMRKAVPKEWHLKAIDVTQHESMAEAIEALFQQDIDIIWTFPDSSLYKTTTVRSLLLASVRKRVPVFGFSPQFVRAGALIGVGVSPETQGRQVARLTVGLLDENDETAEQLKAQSNPAKPEYQIAVNLIVADALSIDIPKDVVRKAHYIFSEDEEEERRP